MMDDLEPLVRKAQQGDPRAFEELLRRCRGRIYRWALVRIGDPDDAEDVTQDVLVTLHRRLAEYRGEARFTTWLYRVTGNAAVSFHRRRDARTRAHGAAADPVAAAVPASLEGEALDASDLAELVTTFFQALPERQREVFDLVDLQGYTAVEAAQMLELEPVTARTHLFRARRTIRARILESHPALVEDRTR